MTNEIQTLEIQTLKEEITRFFKTKKCKFLYVLGSLTSPERFNSESDIDVAVYMDEKIKPYDLHSDLSKSLNTHRSIDLIIMNSADIIIVAQILANGELLLNNDEAFWIDYRAKKMSEYIDFKRSRKIIEDRILDD